MIAVAEYTSEASENTLRAAALYGAEKPLVRKTERTNSTFLETIVGRTGGLRSILAQVEAVAHTNEIGDMPLELQPKLLRVLQEREFEAVGSTRTTKVDVRAVAATNRDLRQMVLSREFREDLYYRLNMFPIYLPPLRDRKRDIPEFVRYFVEHFASSMDKTIDTIPEDTMRSLVRHSWPGNIRELQNYVARGVILSNDGVFEPAPPEESEPVPVETSTANPTLEDKIRQEILAECQRANWKLGGPRGAAARLGLKRTTLFYKMKRLGITPPTDHSQD